MRRRASPRNRSRRPPLIAAYSWMLPFFRTSCCELSPELSSDPVGEVDPTEARVSGGHKRQPLHPSTARDRTGRHHPRHTAAAEPTPAGGARRAGGDRLGALLGCGSSRSARGRSTSARPGCKPWPQWCSWSLARRPSTWCASTDTSCRRCPARCSRPAPQVRSSRPPSSPPQAGSCLPCPRNSWGLSRSPQLGSSPTLNDFSTPDVLGLRLTSLFANKSLRRRQQSAYRPCKRA